MGEDPEDETTRKVQEAQANAALALLLKPQTKKVSPTAMVWAFLLLVVWNLVYCTALGWIGMLAWNGLTDVTHLTTVNFKAGLCVAVILRAAGMLLKVRG